MTNPHEPPDDEVERQPRIIEWFAIHQGLLVVVSAWLAWIVGDLVYVGLWYRMKSELAILIAGIVGVASFFLLWMVLWKLADMFIGRARP